QLRELDLLVASDTGDRRLSRCIAVGESLHHRSLEALLVVEHVVGDAETVGHAAGVVDVLAGTAAAAAPYRLAMIIELERDTDDVVALLLEQRRSHGRIDAA